MHDGVYQLPRVEGNKKSWEPAATEASRAARRFRGCCGVPLAGVGGLEGRRRSWAGVDGTGVATTWVSSAVCWRATGGSGVCGRPAKLSSLVPLLASSRMPGGPSVGALLAGCWLAPGTAAAGGLTPSVGALLAGCWVAPGPVAASVTPSVGALLVGCCVAPGTVAAGGLTPSVGALLEGCCVAPGTVAASVTPSVGALLGGCGVAPGTAFAGCLLSAPVEVAAWSRIPRARLGSGLFSGVKGTPLSPVIEFGPRSKDQGS